MKFIAKVLFLILFILKVSEQLLTSSETDSSSAENYDITHPLNETIVEIFQSVESENVQRLIKTIENKEVLSEGPFTCENITATFDSIQLTYVHAEATRISYEFQEKKIHMHNPQFRVQLRGRVLAGSCAHKIWLFRAEMNFTDYLITAVKGSDQLIDIYHHYGDLRIDIKETTEHYGMQVDSLLLDENRPKSHFTESFHRIRPKVNHFKPSVLFRYFNGQIREEQGYFLSSCILLNCKLDLHFLLSKLKMRSSINQKK